MPLSQELKSSKNEGKWDRVSERLQQNVGLSNILYMKELRARIVNWFTQGYTNAMATHSSVLAWKIPWTEEAGRLQSMGSLRVRHDWATSLSLFPFMHWRMKWQSTPVFLPGESQGRGSLVGCRLWGPHRVGHDWSDLAAAAAVYYIHYNYTILIINIH